MFNQIQKIQQRPENSRRRISFIVSTIITLIIIFVWISVFPSRFNMIKTKTSDTNLTIEETTLKIASPFESIKDDLVDIFGDVINKFNEIKKKIK